MLFTGHSEHPIDAKGRLAVPARYRNAWDQATDGPCWVCMPWPGATEIGTLRLYTFNTFSALSSKYGNSLTPGEDEGELELTLFSLAVQLEMDNEGRVALPKRHLEMSGVGRDVVVVGVRNRLEVHAKSAWNAREMERFKRLPSLIERIERKHAGERA